MRRQLPTFRSKSPLTNDQIMAVAPSIFAEEKHSSRSDRYAVIPTIHVLERLRKEGFEPYMVGQTRTQDEDKRGHAKHIMRLRHKSQFSNMEVGKELDEIILTNSHDGSSSYQMMSGVFRLVCLNGLVSGKTTQDIRVRHSGNVVDNVIEGAFRVLDDFERIAEQKDAMKSVTLDAKEKEIFARGALRLKYDEADKAPVDEAKVLRVKRHEDMRSDLWTTFNVVQENMIKGGLNGRNANGQRVTTRAVTGIDQDIKLNRALWTLAEEMRKLKG